MSTKPKVHRINNRKVITRCRLPYTDLVEVLKSDGEAFLEGPIKRQTVWKAARRLSALTGKKVEVTSALLRLESGGSLAGYSFSVVDQQSQKQKDTF